MDNAWIGLIGALGGILVTSLFGLVLAVVKHRWETNDHSQQRSERLTETRAEGRRNAYIQFLVASEEIANYVIVQSTDGNERATNVTEAMERLRKLQSGADSHFSQYSAALLEAKLLAGSGVAGALVEFDEWMTEQMVTALVAPDPIDAEVFFDLETKREPTIDAMRAEQDADLFA